MDVCGSPGWAAKMLARFAADGRERAEVDTLARALMEGLIPKVEPDEALGLSSAIDFRIGKSSGRNLFSAVGRVDVFDENMPCPTSDLALLEWMAG